MQPFYSPLTRRYHQQLWPPAIAAIERGEPILVMDCAKASADKTVLDTTYSVWRKAHDDGVIDDEQYARFRAAIERLYDPVFVDEGLAYARKKGVQAAGKLTPDREPSPTAALDTGHERRAPSLNR